MHSRLHPHLAARQHSGLPDLLIGIVSVRQDVVTSELQKLHSSKVKGAEGLQRQLDESIALHLACGKSVLRVCEESDACVIVMRCSACAAPT